MSLHQEKHLESEICQHLGALSLNECGTLEVLRRGVEMPGLTEPVQLAQFKRTGDRPMSRLHCHRPRWTCTNSAFHRTIDSAVEHANNRLPDQTFMSPRCPPSAPTT